MDRQTDDRHQLCIMPTWWRGIKSFKIFRACGKVLCYHSLTGNRTIYDYDIDDVHGRQPLDWTSYRDNVVLLVNVASF